MCNNFNNKNLIEVIFISISNFMSGDKAAKKRDL